MAFSEETALRSSYPLYEEWGREETPEEDDDPDRLYDSLKQSGEL